jgi:hypothetical protein
MGFPHSKRYRVIPAPEPEKFERWARSAWRVPMRLGHPRRAAMFAPCRLWVPISWTFRQRAFQTTDLPSRRQYDQAWSHRNIGDDRQLLHVPPGAAIDVAFGCAIQLVLRIEVHSLTSKLAAMIGATPSRQLVFDQVSGIGGSAVSWWSRVIWRNRARSSAPIGWVQVY